MVVADFSSAIRQAGVIGLCRCRRARAGSALHSLILDIPSETELRYGWYMAPYMIHTTVGRPKPRPGRFLWQTAVVAHLQSF
jgi:hypothetical protein